MTSQSAMLSFPSLLSFLFWVCFQHPNTRGLCLRFCVYFLLFRFSVLVLGFCFLSWTVVSVLLPFSVALFVSTISVSMVGFGLCLLGLFFFFPEHSTYRSQKSVIPLSTCAVRSPSFCLVGESKACVAIYFSEVISSNNHPIPRHDPPPTSCLLATWRAKEGSHGSSFSASTNVVTLSRRPLQHWYCCSTNMNPRGRVGGGFPAGAETPPRKGEPIGACPIRAGSDVCSSVPRPVEGGL